MSQAMDIKCKLLHSEWGVEWLGPKIGDSLTHAIPGVRKPQPIESKWQFHQLFTLIYAGSLRFPQRTSTNDGCREQKIATAARSIVISLSNLG